MKDIMNTFTPERLKVRNLRCQPRSKILWVVNSPVILVTKKNLEKLNSSLSHGMLNDAAAKVTKHVDSAKAMIDEIFDCSDSQKLASDLKSGATEIQRLTGTTDSPKSSNLVDGQAVEDYTNEVFSSGDELYNVQWAEINREYNESKCQTDKGFTTSEDDDASEENLNDVTLVDQFRGNQKVIKELALLQQTISPVIRDRQTD